MNESKVKLHLRIQGRVIFANSIDCSRLDFG